MRSLTPSIGVYADSANKIGQGPARRFLADVNSYAHLRAGLVEELRRADDAGDNQLVVNARVENASPGGVAAAVHDAVEELVVVLLDQVLMILGAGEDRGS